MTLRLRGRFNGVNVCCTSMRVRVKIARTQIKPELVAKVSNPSAPMMRLEMETRESPRSIRAKQPDMRTREETLSQTKEEVSTNTRDCPLKSTGTPWHALSHTDTHEWAHTLFFKHKDVECLTT